MDMRERRTYPSMVNHLRLSHICLPLRVRRSSQNQAEGISETLVTLMTLFLRHFIFAKGVFAMV
jgi:hypothetical protein